MTVCKYFLYGTCRYGDRCRFIHPQDNKGMSFSGEYYVSTNQRSLWKPSSPPISQRYYGSSGAESYNRNVGTKKSLFSVNRFDVLSDDEDMEHAQDGSRYSSSAPSSNFMQQRNSGFSLSHLAQSNVAPQHVGLFKPKFASDKPGTIATFQSGNVSPQHFGLFKPKPGLGSTLQTGNVAPQHVGLFKPRPGLGSTLQTGNVAPQHTGLFKPKPSVESLQTGDVAPQHFGLFKPKPSSESASLGSTLQKPIQMSFAPNQFNNTNNAPTQREQQNLFKQASFASNSSNYQSRPFGQPKTLFGKPVEGEQTTGLRSETISRNVVVNTVLSESLWLKELGSDTYTKMDELTQYEKECFTANVFDLRNVPLRPPPKELCF